jgi:hypothetical protein
MTNQNPLTHVSSQAPLQATGGGGAVANAKRGSLTICDVGMHAGRIVLDGDALDHVREEKVKAKRKSGDFTDGES